METMQELRKRRGYSRREVAEELGVSPTTIQNWELGVSEPTVRQWFRLADLFGVRCDKMALPDRKPTDAPPPS
jgi:transcriptional regulator with XRE-family HTH domain